MSDDAPYDSLPPRRRKMLNLRRAGGGVYGVSYGISAFGYPLGAITGVQTPTDPPLSTDQFGGTSVGTTTTAAGSADAGTAGSDSGSGGAAA